MTTGSQKASNGNQSVTTGFPSQKASYAEIVCSSSRLRVICIWSQTSETTFYYALDGPKYESSTMSVPLVVKNGNPGTESSRHTAKLKTAIFSINKFAHKLHWTSTYFTQMQYSTPSYFCIYFLHVLPSQIAFEIFINCLSSCRCLYPGRMVKYVFPHATARVTVIVDDSY